MKENKIRGRIGSAQFALMDEMELNGGKFSFDTRTMSATFIKNRKRMLDGLVKRGLVKFVQNKKSSYYKLV